MSTPFGDTVRDILSLLQEIGPMTRDEICKELNKTGNQISGVITRLSRSSPRHEKRLHIHGWVMDAEGARRYPRAIYAYGNGKDAKKPKSSRKEVARRANEKTRMIYTTNSVFNLGMTRRQFRALSQAVGVNE